MISLNDASSDRHRLDQYTDSAQIKYRFLSILFHYTNWYLELDDIIILMLSVSRSKRWDSISFSRVKTTHSTSIRCRRTISDATSFNTERLKISLSSVPGQRGHLKDEDRKGDQFITLGCRVAVIVISVNCWTKRFERFLRTLSMEEWRFRWRSVTLCETFLKQSTTEALNILMKIRISYPVVDAMTTS